VEARTWTLDFDLRELPRRRTLKALEQLARDTNLDTSGKRDDYHVIGQAIVGGDGPRPLSFRRIRSRDRGVDFRIDCKNTGDCFPHLCISSQAVTIASKCSAAAFKILRTSLRFAFLG
jgi:hypothetical protein